MMRGDVLTDDFKWPITVERRIDVPVDRLWEATSAPGNLEPCHPFCASNPVHSWPGPDSRDEVHYLSGWVFERRFHSWIEGVGYDLQIGRPGGRTSRVSWRIEANGAERSRLRITVCPFALQNTPVVVRWLPHHLFLRPRLASYLSSVVKGFEWYLTRGESVPRNHFGRHPWFS